MNARSFGVGDRLLELLRELRATTSWTMLAEETATISTWRLAGVTWQATVVVDPARWLGLEFTASDPGSDCAVDYSLDTDLYDISDRRHREFADRTERDIAEFLQNLSKGEVLRGRDGPHMVLAFTLNGSHTRIVKGRFMTSTFVETRHGSHPGDAALVPVR